MKGWMAAAVISLAVLSGLAHVGAFAQGSASPQPSRYLEQGCCGGWELEGQALYWRTCTNGDIYAFVREEVATVSQDDFFQTIPADNDWGFRVKGQYTGCGGKTFASLSYLYFDERDHASVSAPGNVRNSYLDILVDIAIGQITTEYQRLDGHVGHYVCRSCKGGLYGYGGISWIYFRKHQRVEGFIGNATPSVNQRSRYSAAGFEAGVGGHYMICGGFGLAAELGGIAAIGERTNRLDAVLGASGVTLQNILPSTTHCVSGLEAKLEAFYERCLCGLKFGLMLGYEQHYYLNPFLEHFLSRGVQANAGNLSYLSRNFGLGGLYFGAKVGY